MAKHYAISDIHGMHDIYDQVKEMLGPDDVVYFLGDACDRGYDCWNTVKDIYNDPQWIYLKGNHEDMMVKGLRQIQDEMASLRGEEDHEMWMWNGGMATEDGWLEDGADMVWVDRLANLPLQVEYTNPDGIIFHMSHAGFTCGRKEEMWGDELVWSRSHFFDHWDEDEYPNDICIHGHTPLEYLIEEMQWHGYGPQKYKYSQPEARAYANGHKIDIDNGVFYTGYTVLFDLDTLEPLVLKDRKFAKWQLETKYGLSEDDYDEDMLEDEDDGEIVF